MSSDAHYDGTPGQPPPAPVPAVVLDKEESGTFEALLEKQAPRIVALLPNNVKKERFLAAASAAVRQNPDLLKCTQRSLFNALAKAAQDGLLPDGREGVITSYNTKIAVRENGALVDRWFPVASWNPMTFGLRKRARELDDIIIDAQVVHKADHFKRVQGDDPKIVHEPADLDSERGPMIGVYAIFKKDQTILHREVMNAKEVQDTRDQSKAKESLMWTTFASEGWRKAVIRRGIKTVPVSESLERAITREDETFDFDQRRDRQAENKPVVSAPSPPAAPPKAPPTPPPARQIEVTPGITLDVPPAKTPETVTVVRHADEPARNISSPDKAVGADEAYKDWLRDSYAELDECKTEAAVEDLRDRVLAELKDADKQPWRDKCAQKAFSLFSPGG